MHCLSSKKFLFIKLPCEFAFLRKLSNIFRLNLSFGRILEYLADGCCLCVKICCGIMAFAKNRIFATYLQPPKTESLPRTCNRQNKKTGTTLVVPAITERFYFIILLRSLLRLLRSIRHRIILRFLLRRKLLLRCLLRRMQHLPL